LIGREHLKSNAVVVRSKKAAQLITNERAWGVAQAQSMSARFRAEEEEIASEVFPSFGMVRAGLHPYIAHRSMFSQAMKLTKQSCELCVQLRDCEEYAAEEMAAIDAVPPSGPFLASERRPDLPLQIINMHP